MHVGVRPIAATVLPCLFLSLTAHAAEPVPRGEFAFGDARADSAGVSELSRESGPAPEAEMLRTGGGEPLATLTLTLNVPPGTGSLLRFEFGFATEEPKTTQTLFDSFSISLQRDNPSTTALFVSADIFGPNWAPPNPGGLLFDPILIRREPIPFPSFGANLRERFSYAVSIPLPLEFIGRPATLFLDLFDNQNQWDSFAFLNNLNISSGYGTNAAPSLVLQSSASAAGPFADEDEAELNDRDQAFTVPRFERTRFYRIRSDSEVKITRFEVVGDRQVCHYDFPSPVVVLQSAPAAEGPFADEARAQVDLQNRSITVPPAGSMRFYRLRSNLHVKVVRKQISASGIIFDFEYEPKIFALQSCATVEGPYADESNVVIDSSNQTMSQSRFGRSRFYRIRSHEPRRISALRFAGENVMIHFAQPSAAAVLQSASAASGPYEDEPSAQVDLPKRTISTVSSGLARFYRIRSDVGTRITSFERSGNQVLLSYE